jgi:acyl-coenzyme A synthetase/AMP-(fatty) acid ligase
VTSTWAEYARQVRDIAAGLARLGVRRGDTVALMMTNRPEFHMVDTAAFHLGAAPFSVYNTFAAEQITQVLSNAGSRVVVCEQQLAPRLLAGKDGTAVEHVVCADGRPDGTITLEELVAGGDRGFGFEHAGRRSSQATSSPWSIPRAPPGRPRGWRSRTRRCSPSCRQRMCCYP